MTSPAEQLIQIGEQWEATYLDDDFERRAETRERLMTWKKEVLSIDEAPLLAALGLKGFMGKSVWELVNTRDRYPELIEALREHAIKDYLDPTKEGIFRALTVRESDDTVYRTLVGEWRRGVGAANQFLRWALANAISYIAKRKQIGELASLMDGNEYWDDPFVRRLKRSEEGRRLLADCKLEVVQ